MRSLSLLVFITAAAVSWAMNSEAQAADEMAAFRPGDKILFQGDSITDEHRGRHPHDPNPLGAGYPVMIAAKFGARHPERRVLFFNRGISGNKVWDLAARWPGDTLAGKPDLVSILIGVNDTAAGVSADDFETAYDELLANTVAALPQVRLVLCEPFTLPAGSLKDNFGPWHGEVRKRAAVVKKLAAKYRAPYVAFQKAFDEACQRAPADRWIPDGIHPSVHGHQLMADEWMRVVSAFYR